MDNQSLTIFASVVVVVVLVAAGFLAYTIRQNILQKAGDTGGEDVVEEPGATFQRASQERYTLIWRIFHNRQSTSWIDRDLVTAGILLKPTEFMAINLFFFAIMMLVAFLHIHSMPANPTLMGFIKRLAWLCLYIFLGWKVPQWILHYLANRRRTKLEYQLADALTIVASSLKGGYSFIQGLDMVAKQLDDPIKMEMARVLRLIQLGMDTPRALQQMAERVNSYDYYMTVSATNIQLAVGGNLASLLEGIAATIRARIRLRRDVAVLTAQGRISGAILIALPICIFFFLFIINHKYMSELTTTTLGNNLLYGAVVMQLCGIYWIKKLLDFDK